MLVVPASKIAESDTPRGATETQPRVCVYARELGSEASSEMLNPYINLQLYFIKIMESISGYQSISGYMSATHVLNTKP